MGIVEQHINPEFTKLFKGRFGFDDKEFSLFFSCFYMGKYGKKDFFLRSGEVSKKKAYLNKGCARVFVIDEHGHERILFFAFEDWWLADFESYYTGKPGTSNIQILEDSELLVINKEDFQRMENEIPKLKQWYIYKMTRSAAATRKRNEDMRTLTPEERYLKLIEKQPQILQRIPLQYIAEYLNIEPQSMSRIRRRLSKSR